MKNNMKWRITGRFLVTVICIVVVVVIINILSVIFAFVYANSDNQSVKEYDTEKFVREFSSNIKEKDRTIYVDEVGKNILDDNKSWIQILDDDNSEIYNYKKPKSIKSKLNPLQLVNMYKYKSAGSHGGTSTNFIYEKKFDDRNISYIIGIEDKNISRYIHTIENDKLFYIVKITFIVTILLDSIIALIFGYLFSRKLTVPLGEILMGVKKLEKGDYNTYYAPKRMYRDLYWSLNNLSITLKQSEKDRKELDIMREEWISNISHDIKTPLASIQGYAEIIKNDDYDFDKEEIIDYARIIESKSKYIKELVEDLNLSTRLKGNSFVLNKETINMSSLVKNIVIDILNNDRYNHVDIDFQCNDNKIEMIGDRILITRTIKNILFNAIVHNDDFIKIKILLEKKDKIIITVKDNGKGIRKEELNKIFNRYYRGTNTGEKHKGSGLGMAIAKEIAIKHGGDIFIESIEGEGTKVKIFFNI